MWDGYSRSRKVKFDTVKNEEKLFHKHLFILRKTGREGRGEGEGGGGGEGERERERERELQ